MDDTIEDLPFNRGARVADDPASDKVGGGVGLKVHEIFVDLLSVERIYNFPFASEPVFLAFWLFSKCFGGRLFGASLGSLFSVASLTHD